jgi:acyl-CoA synthetase (AMP-forming)/AMP-acid ligase II
MGMEGDGSQVGPLTLWSLVEARAEQSPGAVVLVDGAGGSLTFAELRDEALLAAAGFHALGVGEGTIVSWQLPNWMSTFVLTAALARLGAVQNPIAPLFREREVGHIVRQLGADLLLVPTEWRGFAYGEMASAIAATHPRTRVLLLDGDLPTGDPTTLPPAPAVRPAAESPVRWVLYTSGTTSAPKGAQHVDHAFAVTATHMSQRMRMGPEDRNAIVFPFAHIGGILYVFADLIVGSSSVLLERFDRDAVAVLSREGVTIAGAGVPFFQEYLRAQRKADHPIFPKIKGFVGGGGTRPPELHGELIAAFGVGLQGGYGLTEACSFTMSDRDDPDEIRARTEGRPYPGAEIRIVDPTGAVLPAGGEGEICLRGPQLMRGYVDSSQDAEVFDAEGFFRTGDLGRLDDEGNLYVTGRIKDVVIRNGENISAREVEDLIYLHPAVEEVAVIGLPDPMTGERACAVVVLSEDLPAADAPTLAELRTFLTDKGLAIQKVPEQLEVVAALEKNVGGKVHKPSLQATYRDRPFVRSDRTDEGEG